MDDYKICPYCGEKIKKDAVKCRYCLEMLPNAVEYQQEESVQTPKSTAPKPPKKKEHITIEKHEEEVIVDRGTKRMEEEEEEEEGVYASPKKDVSTDREEEEEEQDYDEEADFPKKKSKVFNVKNLKYLGIFVLVIVVVFGGYQLTKTFMKRQPSKKEAITLRVIAPVNIPISLPRFTDTTARLGTERVPVQDRVEKERTKKQRGEDNTLPNQTIIETLKSLLSSPPEDADQYLFTMALILYKQSKYKDAWGYFEKIKNPNKQAQILGASLALILDNKDRFEGLVKGLPETDAVNLNLAGITYYLKGDYEKAMERFSDAMKKDDKEPIYQLNYFTSVYLASKKDGEDKKVEDEAISQLKKIEHPYAYYNLYEVFTGSKQNEAAKIYLDKLNKTKDEYLLSIIKKEGN